uniref:Uncharacterized protein n=1 Tax=Bactrocera latifrons TaxID=174628 RepID=A0A0K8UEY7_BACLA
MKAWGKKNRSVSAKLCTLSIYSNTFLYLGCCIYKKPVSFGESSSSDDDECEHCFGHPEKRRRNINKSHNQGNDLTDNNSNENRESEIDITEIQQPKDENGSHVISD